MPQKRKTKWSIRTLTMAMTAYVMATLCMPLAFAETQSKPAADSSSFNVTEYLSAGGQSQEYLTQNGQKRDAPIASFIVEIINFLALTIGSFSFLAVVVGGFILLTSHGNETQVTKGKDVIKYAIIGLVVTLSSYFITAFVQSLFYEVAQ